MKTHYDALGIAKTADSKEIKAIYRKLAKKYHPDLNPGDKEAEIKFKEINDAYQILGDEESRRKYDNELNNPNVKKRDVNKNSTNKSKPEDSHFNFDVNNFASGFESFFGFDPKGKQVKDIDKAEEKDPIDTNKAFESFFGFKGK